jgi:hypothetical protein
MTLALVYASIVMTIWKRYKVNYPFILEIDLTHKLTAVDVFKFSSTLMTIWLFCYYGDLCIIKYEYYFKHTPAAFLVTLFIIFFGGLLLPFKALYPRARFAFLKTFA